MWIFNFELTFAVDRLNFLSTTNVNPENLYFEGGADPIDRGAASIPSSLTT